MAARCNQRLRLESRAREGDGDGSAVQRGVKHGVDDHALANAFWREREGDAKHGGCNADEEAGKTEGGRLAAVNAAGRPCSLDGGVVPVLQRMRLKLAPTFHGVA